MNAFAPLLTAVVMLGSAAQGAPQDAVSLIARATPLLQHGRPAEAETLLRQALVLDPHSLLAHGYLAEALAAQGKDEEALAHDEAVLAVTPADRRARAGEAKAGIHLALNARAHGDADAALRTLERCAQFVPDDAELLVDLGLQAQSMHQLGLAGRSLAQALELAPDDARTLYAAAHVELDEQHFPDAEKHLRAYLQQKPDDATAHYGLGHLLQMQQRTEEARREFERSLQLQPVQTESYYQLGQMALDAEQEEDARRNFAIVLARMPAHGGALTGTGILDYRAHRYETARTALQQAVQAAPDYQPAHYYLGLTLRRLGESGAAERELATAARLAGQQQGQGQPKSEP